MRTICCRALYVTVAPAVRLYVREWGQGRPLVFIHGWLISDEAYGDQLSALARQGYRVLAITLRGYGKSDKPAGEYTFDVYADDIRAVIESFGLEQVTLAGFSLGGAIAIHYMARHHGAHVAKLALFGAAAPVWTRRCLATALARAVALLGGWVAWLGSRASRHALAQCLLALRDADLRPALTAIQVPTTIFHALEDRICPFPFAEALADGIAGASLVPFHGSSHGLFAEEPTKFTRELVAFLDAA